MIHEAIFALYPNVTTCRDDVAYDINENIVEYDKSAVEAKVKELEAEYIAKQQAKEVNKKEAEAKLAKLGLTPEDLKMLLG